MFFMLFEYRPIDLVGTDLAIKMKRVL